MNGQSCPPYETAYPMPTLEAALGYSFQTNLLPTPERELIFAATAGEIRNQRDRFHTLARSAGMIITQQELEAWTPRDSQLVELNKVLREERKRARMLDGVSLYLDSDRVEDLRFQQHEAVHQTRAFFEYGPRSQGKAKKCFLNMATGTGKTGYYVNLVSALKSEEDPNDPNDILVLVPSVYLMFQALGIPAHEGDELQGFAKFAPHLKPTVYYQDVKELSSLTIMLNASFNQLMDSDKMPHFSGVIIDETHTGLGESISDNLAKYCRDKIVVGVTGTPDYNTDKRCTEILENEIYRFTLPQAIKRRALAPLTTITHELDIELLTLEESGLDPEEYRIARQKALINAQLEYVMPDIMDTLENKYGVLIRCPAGGDIGYAKHVAEALRTPDSLADAVPPRIVRAVALGGSKQKVTDQELILSAFRRGPRVEAVSYVKGLNMGVDVPRAKLLIDLVSSMSAVDVAQALGRITRLIFDEKGDPIPARAIYFRDQRLGDKQITGAHILKGILADPPFDWRRKFAKEQSRSKTEIHEVDALDYTAIPVHTTTEKVVPDTDIAHAIDPTPAENLDKNYDLAAAARWFDIGVSFFTQYLEQLGYDDPAQVKLEERDLAIIEELYPELHIPLAPSTAITIDEVRQVIGYNDTERAFVLDLECQNVTVAKMRDPRTGEVSHYIDRSYIE